MIGLLQRKDKNKSVFRIYWYEGHIMFAVPRKQYAKVALDTERAKTAYKIAESYGMDYYDNNQLQMYKSYGDSFGNEIWLKENRQNCTLWVGFCQHHELRVQIECKTKKYARELLEVFEGSDYIDDDERWIKIPYQTHFKYQKHIGTWQKFWKIYLILYLNFNPQFTKRD